MAGVESGRASNAAGTLYDYNLKNAVLVPHSSDAKPADKSSS